jgi:hypothetical protein
MLLSLLKNVTILAQKKNVTIVTIQMTPCVVRDLDEGDADWSSLISSIDNKSSSTKVEDTVEQCMHIFYPFIR